MSTYSQVRISNIALSRIGSTQTISSFTDGSNEANQCALVWDLAREDLLHAFPWQFATAYQQLALVSTNPNGEWMYSYRMPVDSIWIHRLFPTPVPPGTVPLAYPGQVLVNAWPDRGDTNPYPWPFEKAQDAAGQIILTDLPNATAKYTKDITDASLFDADFANLLAWRMAVEISYSLAISDNRREFAQKMYEQDLWKSRSHDANEMQNDQPYVDYNSEFIRARQ